jgi:hypothetical protein
VTTQTDLREQPVTQVQASRFAYRGASAVPEPAGRAAQAYAEVDLSGGAGKYDFDAATVAIVSGIVVFKLLMLSVLIVAF